MSKLCLILLLIGLFAFAKTEDDDDSKVTDLIKQFITAHLKPIDANYRVQSESSFLTFAKVNEMEVQLSVSLEDSKFTKGFDKVSSISAQFKWDRIRITYQLDDVQMTSPKAKTIYRGFQQELAPRFTFNGPIEFNVQSIQCEVGLYGWQRRHPTNAHTDHTNVLFMNDFKADMSKMVNEAGEAYDGENKLFSAVFQNYVEHTTGRWLDGIIKANNGELVAKIKGAFPDRIRT